MGECAECVPRSFKNHWNDTILWIGGCPQGELAGVVHAAVAKRGLRTFGAVSTCVAAELFARDNARAGGIGDLGFFRGWYLVIACRLLDSLRGTAIEVRPPTSTASAAGAS